MLEAIVDSGRVLCHVKKGERTIPLAQLEAFFRALLGVYRAEAAAAAWTGTPASPEEPEWRTGNPACPEEPVATADVINEEETGRIASDDEIALISNALQKFASDPVEANRWYSRARFALSDETVRREAPSRPRDREEVLGIWENLERQVEIPKVAGVVSWLRRAG